MEIADEYLLVATSVAALVVEGWSVYWRIWRMRRGYRVRRCTGIEGQLLGAIKSGTE